mgnify:CR=1 FL=1
MSRSGRIPITIPENTEVKIENNVIFAKGLPETRLWGRRKYLFIQHAFKQAVHAIHGVANAHGGKGIAVIAIARRLQCAIFQVALGMPNTE